MAYLNRRNFIKESTSALAYAMIGPYALDITHRSKPWRVALIGTGWYGKSDLFRLMQVAHVEVVGLCDVDSRQLSVANDRIKARLNQSKDIPQYKDYRVLINETAPEIALIGTPDHWHALQAIEAIKSGAHVYLQKPISIDVLEGEAILAAARRYNRVVQIGTQRRSTAHLMEAKETIVESGMLGHISHVEMCCYYHMRANSRPDIQPIPDHLDYDMYVGPAPFRPYDGLPHRGWWRALMEYSNGIMGDMCVHMYDTVRWMLGLGWPDKIYSTGGIFIQKESKANTPDTQTAIFTHNGLNCTWQHRSWGSPVDPDYPWGFFIYGDKGTLKGSVHKYEFIPHDGSPIIRRDVVYEKEKYPEDLTESDIELHTAPATRGQMIDFLKAIETGVRPVADIEEGHISSASCIMANLSMKTGRSLTYDADQQIIKDDNEATELLKRAYRGPWVHPYLTIHRN